MARKPKNLDTVVRKEPKKRTPRTKKVNNDEVKTEVVVQPTVSDVFTPEPIKTDIPVVEKAEENVTTNTNVNNMYLGLLIIAALALPVLVYLGIR